jgi:predicted methyltransferase
MDNMDKTTYQILTTLQKGPMSFWEIVRSQDSTLAAATRSIRSLLGEDQITFDERSRKFSLQSFSQVLPGCNGPCPTCEGKSVVLDGRFEETLEDFLRLTRDRPPPIFEYNQGIIDPRDLALKAALMAQRGDLEGRSILLMGDDDLFSLFLALLGLARRIVVLEIDDRLIRYITKNTQSKNLAISPRQHDVNTPLPVDLQGACDTFVTEPPEGLKGMFVFLNRAIDALHTGGSGYFGLTTLESSLPKWLAIQRFLLNRGMVITDLLRNFSLYPEAGDPIMDYDKFQISREFPVSPGPPDVDYFRSSLIRVEKTDRRTIKDDEGFYTDEDTWVTMDPEDAE